MFIQSTGPPALRSLGWTSIHPWHLTDCRYHIWRNQKCQAARPILPASYSTNPHGTKRTQAATKRAAISDVRVRSTSGERRSRSLESWYLQEKHAVLHAPSIDIKGSLNAPIHVHDPSTPSRYKRNISTSLRHLNVVLAILLNWMKLKIVFLVSRPEPSPCTHSKTISTRED